MSAAGPLVLCITTILACQKQVLFPILAYTSPPPPNSNHCEVNTPAQAAPGVSFNKNYLYDGPWRVLWKTNTAWQRYFDPLNSVADNRAYQWYKEVRRVPPRTQRRLVGSLVGWLACTRSRNHGNSRED